MSVMGIFGVNVRDVHIHPYMQTHSSSKLKVCYFMWYRFGCLHMPALGVVVPLSSDDWRPVDKFNRFSHSAGWGTRWVLLCLWFWVCVHVLQADTPHFSFIWHFLTFTLSYPEAFPPPPLSHSRSFSLSLWNALSQTHTHTHGLMKPVHINSVLADELEHEHILTFFRSFLHSLQSASIPGRKRTQAIWLFHGRALWLSLFSLVSLIPPSYRCKWPERWKRCCLYETRWGHIISCEDPGGRGWAVWAAGINHTVITSLFNHTLFIN